MDKNIRCILCGNALEKDFALVKEKGLAKIIQSSIARDDGKAESFMNRTEVKLHIRCRRSYINDKCIAAVQRRKKKELAKESGSFSEFDFQNNCLFCHKDASTLFEEQQSKNPESNRVTVGQVDELEKQNIILQACRQIDDFWSQQVLSRINNNNILEKRARYHEYCYNNFCHSNRPGTEDSEAMDQFDEDSMSDSEAQHSIKMEPEEVNLAELDTEMPPESGPSVKQEPEQEVPPHDDNDPLKPEPVHIASPVLIQHHSAGTPYYNNVRSVAPAINHTTNYAGIAGTSLNNTREDESPRTSRTRETENSTSAVTMDSTDDNMDTLSPKEIQEITGNVLPLKSRAKYVKAYNQLVTWMKDTKTTSFSETVLLAYFNELAKTLKPSTLWGIYSMLKATITMEHGIDIKTYSKLIKFLKSQYSGFESKRSWVLTAENVESFLREAPDDYYLATKIALIFGVNGACTASELVNLKTSDVQEHNDIFVINLLNRTHKDRSFVVRDEFFNMTKKYRNLRPQYIDHDRFFVNYFKGKCTRQPLGRHRLSGIPKTIANYLNLPNAECYTGHCFRRTSAKFLADSGANVTTLKRHGGWASDMAAAAFIKESKKMRTNDQINKNIEGTTATTSHPSTSYEDALTTTPVIIEVMSLPAELTENENILINVPGGKGKFTSLKTASDMSWSQSKSGQPLVSIPFQRSRLEPETSTARPDPSGSLTPEPSRKELVLQKCSPVGNCRICGLALTHDVITVRYKGYLNLQRASALHRDSKFPAGTEHELIEVRLHTECKTRYIKECSVRMSLQMQMQRELNPNSAREKFDYLEQCLFCGSDASESYMKSILKIPCEKRRTRTVSKFKQPGIAERLYRQSLDLPDSEFAEFRKRVKNMDLVGLQARYHTSCYRNFFGYQRKIVHPNEPPKPRGRPSGEMQPQAFEYIENNWEDSQFSVEDLKKLGQVSIKTLIRKLEERSYSVIHHKNEIVINPPPKKILEEKWHQDALDDEQSERLRIVKTAANIILEDIRANYFDNNNYPAASSFLDEVNSVVPETLRIFAETVVTKHNTNPEPLESRVTALSHSIMTAARSRSFKSPLLLGIGSLIHQKYASKSLIDLLSSIGFCASYKDVTQLELSVAANDSKYYKPEFTQFVVGSIETDNGPIVLAVQCNTPRKEDTAIAKQDKVPDYIKRKYCQPLKKYRATTNSENILIEDHRVDTAILPTRNDALWLLGKSEPSLSLPAWDKFISKIPRDKEYPVSEIIPLPLKEAPPSNDAIYTALTEAQMKTKGTCIVTFDEPMYQAAQEIVKSYIEMNNIVLKLGAFDVMKSFLGVIGYIMSGSGLKELWCSIYAAENIEKMMTGHAFPRAIRAHFLTRSALFNIITKDFDITPEERLEIEGILEGDYIPEDNQRSCQEPLAITLELLERKGPTAQLWVQYFRMTTLVAQFLEAEITANWDLHLSTLKKMLPYFHAAGYYQYAKSCSWYLQDMKALESKMSEEEFERFTKKGYFAVRWTEDFDWSDRAVEKTMALFKRPGGLTNGTKVTDNYLTTWRSASPALSIVSILVENFCKPSEEIVEPSKNKDNQDSAKILSWFEEHSPFAENRNLLSLSTGKIGNVNCHEAEMVGKQMMKEIIGLTYTDVFHVRSKCIRPLSIDKSIEIEYLKVPIEPDTILKRVGNIIVTKKNQKEKIKSFFEYELAPYPLSLFDDQGILEANKSSLFKFFSPVDITDEHNQFHVVDGEFLLRKVEWKDDMTVSAISYSYVEYIKTRFKNAIVIFGGNQVPDTARPRKVKKSPVVEFQKDTVLTVDKESFLENEKNKDRFVQYLIIDFTRSGIKIKLSSNDSHSSIIETAIDNASTYDKTFIVSDDADLLIKMCVSSNKENVYFMKPSGKPKYFHFDSIQSNKIKLSLLFLHAVSGCESTSAIFHQGKTRTFLKLADMYARDIKNLMTIFANPTSDKKEIAEVGINFFRSLYDDLNEYDDLTAFRYGRFAEIITKSRFDLARLPPSKDAVKHHMYRVFYQIQKWLGNDLAPTEWGWKLVGDRLEPIYSDKIAPKELLDMISCKCDGVCSINCTCKRINLDCCVLCVNCNGKSCHGLEMEADSGTFIAHLQCDAFGNPVDPTFNIDADDDDDDEEEVPEPAPRAKRAKRDNVTFDEQMREERCDEEVRQQEIEHVVLEDDDFAFVYDT